MAGTVIGGTDRPHQHRTVNAQADFGNGDGRDGDGADRWAVEV